VDATTLPNSFLIWETTIPQIAVKRKKQENNVVGKVERKANNLLDWSSTAFTL